MLTESRLAALEKARADKGEEDRKTPRWGVFPTNDGAFESEHPGHCVAQDSFCVGTLKGVGRVCQQTAIDTCAKVGFARLCDRKTALTAADPARATG